MKNKGDDDNNDLDVEAMRDWDNGEDATGSPVGKSLFGGLLAILGNNKKYGGPVGRGSIAGGGGGKVTDKKLLIGGLGGALGIRAGPPVVVETSSAGNPEVGVGPEKSGKETLRQVSFRGQERSSANHPKDCPDRKSRLRSRTPSFNILLKP